MKIKRLSIAFLCAAALFGCEKKTAPAATNPDLLPVPDPRPEVGFSIIERAHTATSDLALVITIKNRGVTEAAPTTTTVLFRNGEFAVPPIDVPTPALTAGASVTVHVPVPSNCFRPDCGFEIEVDSKHVINETDETNNKGGGGIVG